MRCPNCGYEIDKPNKKSCPLCGCKITREELLTVEAAPQEMAVPVADDAEAVRPQTPITPQPSEPAPVMVECSRCYKSVLEDANFCPYCGCDMRKPKVEAPHIEMYAQQPQQPIQPVPNIQIAVEEVPMADEDTQTFSDDVVEEELLDDSISTNVREENLDQYVDNGAYLPYDDEEEADDSMPQETAGSLSWLIIGIAAISGILLGALLYYICA